MSLIVAPATHADMERFAAIENAAIKRDAVNNTLFPGLSEEEEEDIPRAETLLQFMLSDPSCRAIKVIDESRQAIGKEPIIAFSFWYFCDEERPIELPADIWASGTNKDACELYFGGLKRLWRDALNGRRHACKCLND